MLKSFVERPERSCHTSKTPFEKHDAHFSKVVFFDELAEDGKAMLTQSQGIYLPNWEDSYQKTLRSSKDKAYTAANPPMPQRIRKKPGKKRSFARRLR